MQLTLFKKKKVLSVFRSFDGFREYFGHFNVLEVFWSFFRFKRYFGHFKISGGIYFILGLGGILVILEDLWVFWSF